MNFKFYPKESKLYDFLEFPRLLYYKEDFEDFNSDLYYGDVVKDEYLDFVNNTKNKLKPYAKEIEIFYMKHFLNKYDFINFMSMANGIFSYKDEKDYLNKLLTFDDSEIKKSIVYSIMVIDNESEATVENIKKAEEISADSSEMISFIKELQIDSGAKWNLFLIIEEPKKYMRIYVELMTSLLPLFEEIYSRFQDEVTNYGKYLVDYLNKNGAKGLNEITNSILDAKLLDEGDINLLISVMFSYAISIIPSVEEKYIAWGLRIEDSFKKMREINENKTIERVQIFKNLGDKTRYEVLKLISKGQTSTKEIASALGVSSATISYHINNFVTSKVIKMDKSESKFGYVVDYDLLEETLQAFKEDLDFPNKNS